MISKKTVILLGLVCFAEGGIVVFFTPIIGLLAGFCGIIECIIGLGMIVFPIELRDMHLTKYIKRANKT